MAPAEAAKPGLNVRDLPPNIFAVVMATGIVSIAINGAGNHLMAHILFWEESMLGQSDRDKMRNVRRRLGSGFRIG